MDEPGGYRALVFDQGDRITQSISAADVADICLRALHEPEGRNKTFDVCYEYQVRRVAGWAFAEQARYGTLQRSLCRGAVFGGNGAHTHVPAVVPPVLLCAGLSASLADAAPPS